MISTLEALRKELYVPVEGDCPMRIYLMARGYREHLNDPNVIARAYAFSNLFDKMMIHIYENDLIVGSVRGLIGFDDPNFSAAAQAIFNSYGANTFGTNADHFCPDYSYILSRGVGGILEDIEKSLAKNRSEESQNFLTAAKLTMEAFSRHISRYATLAEEKGKPVVAANCRHIAEKAPETFPQALQLVWFVHTAYFIEGRYAMALGRLDQYLYPFYKADIEAGRLTDKEALDYIACTLLKIGESQLFGGDNTCNIAIGGVKPSDGTSAVNPLTYHILTAVRECNIPGPNLSARMHKDAPLEFLDACLEVIGTGLGYPALMNDEANIPALMRYGYELEDCRNYCMVGCIENFLPGQQPPWSDGRYNSPVYLERALNGGVNFAGTSYGIECPDVDSFETMEDFVKAVEDQMRFGADEYCASFNNNNNRYNYYNYQQPFLSCGCPDCIERGLDINRGGTKYASVHGAGCMGIATMADSLYAIEEVVFNRKLLKFSELRDILKANFEGHEDLRKMLLALPKYGNDIPEVDKYAVWFNKAHYDVFKDHKTRDGGGFYVAIASNIASIYAGGEIGATPDGRLSGTPLSDAASPMHGRDLNGPTAAFKSLSRPDYTYAACGTVVNQKYSPEMFSDPEKRAKLASIIRAYFMMGGQEVQINSVSRQTLIDAMENPEDYRSLVTRVSGFSAYYTQLAKEVQEDILKRTEHDH
ncbi:MAG: hypothetical protein IJA85_00570 [Clostridia bacterium]|nr:hypothetical protein [Clostridia bacterium]